jgi:uroporphyrinogen decarboxylase
MDRLPVALWRHFPVDDQSPDTLADATLLFQNMYDFDLVKVSPASSFCLKDWGITDAWEGSTEGTRRYTNRVINKPLDWETLLPLEPTAPHLAGQLACLRQIRRRLGPSVPMLQTIFSPLAQAKNLCGGETLLVHLRKYPEALMKGLETISLSTQRFVEAALKTGIDGVFYAIQHAQAELLTLGEYKTFGVPFDHKSLEPAGDLWCNMLHLHGSNIHFEIVSDFSFQIINWHDRDTSPSLTEALKAAGVFSKSSLNEREKAGTSGVSARFAVCGGLALDTLVYGQQNDVRKEARNAIAQTKGRRLILSTGCVVPIIASHGNILAARQSLDSPQSIAKTSPLPKFGANA